MKRLALALVLGLILAPAVAWADRGLIPFKPQVKLFEPKQRVMLAWDGQEEILLLSTDLRASEPTRILEVMPLPAEPQVKKGDVETFRKAVALINRKLQPVLKGRLPTAAKSAAEVTFHKKIGAHDISVTRVRDPAGFIRWVENYLRTQGVRNPLISPEHKALIKEYLEDGYTWFVFDVVQVDAVPSTGEAIQYRFKSSYLYYPLRITRTAQGHTDIELLVLSPRLLTTFSGIPKSQVELRHPPVSLTPAELRLLNPDMAALLGYQGDMKLRIWRIRGELASFHQDLLAY